MWKSGVGPKTGNGASGVSFKWKKSVSVLRSMKSLF